MKRAGDDAACKPVSHQPGRVLHGRCGTGSAGRADHAGFHAARSGRRAITTAARIENEQPVGCRVAGVSRLDFLDGQSRQAGSFGEHPGQHPDFTHDAKPNVGMRRCGSPGLEDNLGPDAGRIAACQQNRRLFGWWHQFTRGRSWGRVIWLEHPHEPTMMRMRQRDARAVAPSVSFSRSDWQAQTWIASSHGRHSSRWR